MMDDLVRQVLQDIEDAAASLKELKFFTQKEFQVLQDIAEAAALLKDLKFFTQEELPKLDECTFCGGSARLH